MVHVYVHQDMQHHHVPHAPPIIMVHHVPIVLPPSHVRVMVHVILVQVHVYVPRQGLRVMAHVVNVPRVIMATYVRNVQPLHQVYVMEWVHVPMVLMVMVNVHVIVVIRARIARCQPLI
jgi:hypothetical protein